MPVVNFNKFTISEGKARANGLASGLDTSTLIDSIIEAKKLPAKAIEEDIAVSTSKLAAFQELSQLLVNFKGSLNALRAKPAIESDKSDVFQLRTLNITSNLSVPPSNYVTISAEKGASVDSFSLSNIKLATRAMQSVQGFKAKEGVSVVSAKPNVGMFTAGTFSINDVEIKLTEGQDLNSVVKAINTVSSVTNVTASVIKISSENFQLSLRSTKPGIENAYNIEDEDNIFLNNANLNWKVIPAEDASITYNGQVITRSSNLMKDVLENVTIELIQSAPPDTEINVYTTHDISSVKEAIKGFVDAYNKLLTFNVRMNERDQQTHTYVKTAALGGDDTLASIIKTIGIEAISPVVGIPMSNKEPNLLADIGITLQDIPPTVTTPKIPNCLSIDEDKLNNMLRSDFDKVRKIFVMDYHSSESSHVLTSWTNDSSLTSFTVNINHSLQQTITSPAFQNITESVVSQEPVDRKFAPGVFRIKNTEIEIKEGDSLTDIKNKINEKSVKTKVKADLVAMAGNNGHYQLIISAQENSKGSGFSITDENNIFINHPFFNDIKNSLPFKKEASFADSVTITHSNGSFNANYKADLSGGTIIGPEKTPLEGMKLLYTGGFNVDSSSTITFTQGIADRLYNIVAAFLFEQNMSKESHYTKGKSGILQVATKDITDKNVMLDLKLKSHMSAIEVDMKALTEKFTKNEINIQKFNIIIMQLEAQESARKSAAG